MFRRLWMIPVAALLMACLAVLPACKKKAPENDNPNPAPIAGPGPTPPAAASSDHVLYLHLNAKSIRDSALFSEIKQAFTKAGGTDVWDKIEGDAARDLGFKPTDLDSVTFVVTEIPPPRPPVKFTPGAPPPPPPPRNDPKFVVILTSSKAFDKTTAFKLGKNAKPDARGFYTQHGDQIHFPDEKTAVMLHPDLAQKYLDGFAKNRTGWPMTAELTKAAEGHTLYAAFNVKQLPTAVRQEVGGEELAPLMSVQTVTLTGDLKGKELDLAVRGTFPDAVTASKAKEMIQGFIGMATFAVQQFATGKDINRLPGLKPGVGEAQRALKEAKLAASGSDVTLTATYKVDFDLNALAADVVKQVREEAPKSKLQNNLKQIGFALHNYASANNDRLIIHGVGPKGVMLKNPTEKPLLSWRVAILPYIEEDNLYRQFKLDEPWDSEHNKKLIPQMPKLFAPVKSPGKPGYTHLQMVIGPSAMQPGRYSIANIPDGTSNTLAVVEATEPVIWTKPDDIMLPGKELPKDFRKKFGGEFPNGFYAVLWDASVRFVPATVSDRTLSIAINPADGLLLPADWNNR